MTQRCNRNLIAHTKRLMLITAATVALTHSAACSGGQIPEHRIQKTIEVLEARIGMLESIKDDRGIEKEATKEPMP